MDKILTYSWNVSGLNLCEFDSITGNKKLSKKLVRDILNKKCTIPSIALKILEDLNKINDQVFLVVICTESEPKHNSYFHSDVLPGLMKSKDFYMLKKGKLNNSGSPNLSSRISIYAPKLIRNEFQSEEIEITKIFDNKGIYSQNKLDEGRYMSMILTLVWHPLYGRFSFVNVNLPIKDLDFKNYDEYLKYRSFICSSNSSMLNALIAKVNAIKYYKKPQYLIILGTFNFDLVPESEEELAVVVEMLENDKGFGIKELKFLLNYDELRNLIKQNVVLRGFMEGPANSGPLFLPTGPLRIDRESICSPDQKKEINIIGEGCFVNNNGNTYLGWRERTLYKELDDSDSEFNMHCIHYDRIDIGEMKKGFNAGIVTLFQLIRRQNYFNKNF